MTDSAFNPDIFLGTEVRAKMQTHYVPIPEGEYRATIKEVKYRNPKPEVHILDVHYNVEVPEDVRARLNLPEEAVARQSIFLDVENGALATGTNKNVRLGKLRDAVRQNGEGTWRINQLNGAGPVFIQIKHRQDENDPDVTYTDVSRVAPAR